MIFYLRAIVAKSRLIGGPAALLPVQPERIGADAVLEVRQPCGADIDDTRHSAGCQADEEDAEPAGPGVMSRFDKVPNRVLFVLDDVAVAHPIAG